MVAHVMFTCHLYFKTAAFKEPGQPSSLQAKPRMKFSKTVLLTVLLSVSVAADQIPNQNEHNNAPTEPTLASQAPLPNLKPKSTHIGALMNLIAGGRYGGTSGKAFIPRHYDRIAEKLGLKIRDPANDDMFLAQLVDQRFVESPTFSVDAVTSPMMTEGASGAGSAIEMKNHAAANEENPATNSAANEENPATNSSQTASEERGRILLDVADTATKMGKMSLAHRALEQYLQTYFALRGKQVVLSKILTEMEASGHCLSVWKMMTSNALLEMCNIDHIDSVRYALRTECPSVNFWTRLSFIHRIDALAIMEEEYKQAGEDVGEQARVLNRHLQVLVEAIKHDRSLLFHSLLFDINKYSGLFTPKLNRETRGPIPRDPRIDKLSDLMSLVIRYGNDHTKMRSMLGTLMLGRENGRGYVQKSHILNAINEIKRRRQGDSAEVSALFERAVLQRAPNSFSNTIVDELKNAFESQLGKFARRTKDEVDHSRASFMSEFND